MQLHNLWGGFSSKFLGGKEKVVTSHFVDGIEGINLEVISIFPLFSVTFSDYIINLRLPPRL